ncbi:MAG: hypothetical protein V1853_03035 [bacterium]
MKWAALLTAGFVLLDLITYLVIIDTPGWKYLCQNNQLGSTTVVMVSWVIEAFVVALVGLGKKDLQSYIRNSLTGKG